MKRDRLAVTGLAAGIVGAMMLQAVCVQSASADIVDIESFEDASTEGKGRFTGSLDYWFDSLSTTGLLTITLTNRTDDAPLRSYITGIVFNIGSADPDRSSSLIATSHDQFVNVNDESGGQFGSSFDGGVAIGGDWLGGGDPDSGLAPGETGVFTFAITADDASDLRASSFLDGPYDHNFLVRFRGGDFSDKVPAVIPAPAALAAFAFAGLCGSRRRRYSTRS